MLRFFPWAVCAMLAGCAATPPAEEPLLREGTYTPIPRTSNTASSAGAASSPSAAPAASAAPADAQPLPPPRRPVIRPTRASASSSARAPGGGASAARTPENGGGAARPMASARPDLNDGKVLLNFVDADLQAVLRALARFTGRNFLVDPRVKGQLTLVSDGEVEADTAYGMLLGALRMQGYTIVDVGGVSRVVPVADAKLQGGGVNEAEPGGGMATRTFRLAYENAEKLVPILRPMIAPDNPITAYPGNNTIVVTDYADNLDRIGRIIESIDTPTALDTDVVKIYNGVALDIAAMAADLLATGGGQQADGIAVVADPRSNSVVIRSSSPERTAIARDLVVKLDNVQTDPGNLHVVHLRNAQATQLARVLRGVLTGESDAAALGGDDAVRQALGAGGMLAGAGGGLGGSSSSSSSSGSAGSTGAAGTGGAGGVGTLRGGQRDAGANGMPGSGQDSGAFSAGGVTVMADVTTNTLILSAPEPMYRSLRKVIDLLDQRRAQVLVESLIVEVTEDNAAELGIQWMTGNGRWFGGASLGGSGINASARTTLDAAPRGLNIGIIDGTVSLPGVGEILNLELLARALESRNGVNILSTPNLLTLDNEPAAIMVGRTLPFVSGQYITDGGGGSNNPFQTVEREDIGLKLNIRPQISEGGTVKLDIYQEVSTLDDVASANLGGIVTNKRAIDTSVLLDDGQIMVLGGLLEDSVQSGSDAVPVLGDIPVLGALFRYESRRRVKTNLMVFLRPYVVRDANAGRGLTQDRYDYMRRVQARAQPASHPLLGDIAAPVLPPAGVPRAGRAEPYDLRPEQWDDTRALPPPATQSSSSTTPPLASSAQDGQPEPVRTRLPAGLTVSADPEALYGQAANAGTVIQFAQAREQSEAIRVAQRARISGLKAYALAGPGGMDYVVRVDAGRDPNNVDAAVRILRELGYQPELVVTP